MWPKFPDIKVEGESLKYLNQEIDPIGNRTWARQVINNGHSYSQIPCYSFCNVNAKLMKNYELSFQIHKSTESQVVLKRVNLFSTGRYRCEVSAEAPSFQTVSDHGDMTVVGE